MSNNKQPRGLRLNNPGNIRHGGSKWKGASADQPDKSFVKFNRLADGYRALTILLNNYYNIRHLYTIRAILMRYAPPNENNTEGYIKRVAKTLIHQPLPPPTSVGSGNFLSSVGPQPHQVAAVNTPFAPSGEGAGLKGGDIADMILPPPKEDQVLWTRIIMAMTMVEQGIKEEEVDQTAIEKGFLLAFGPKEMKNEK